MTTKENPGGGTTGVEPSTTTYRDYTAIPQELQALRQWVGWKLEPRDGKPTKVPINPRTGKLAKSNDPTTWGPVDEAIAAVTRFGLNGPGFMFSKDDPYVGIDLDHCLGDDGQPNVFAEHILGKITSYTEISPSGRGLHIIAKGTIPTGRKKGALEMYSSVRFFTMTGHVFQGRDTIRDADLETVYREQFGQDKAKADESRADDRRRQELSDEDVLAVARGAKNSAKFLSLWAGDWSGYYPSQSEGDSGLCMLLAFYTQKDAAQMDRLFRRSGLMRPKWDERHYSNGWTYGEGTISNGIEVCRDTYSANEDGDGRPDPTADDGLARLSKLLGVEVKTVWKRGRDQGSSWELELTDRTMVVVGGGDSLLNFKRTQSAILNSTRVVIPYYEREDWAQVVRLIATLAVETKNVTEEEETAEYLREWVMHCDRPCLDTGVTAKRLQQLQQGGGWLHLDRDRIAIRGTAFHHNLTDRLHLKLSYRELGLRLGRIGFVNDRLQCRDSDTGTTIGVRVWISPDHWWRHVEEL